MTEEEKVNLAIKQTLRKMRKEQIRNSVTKTRGTGAMDRTVFQSGGFNSLVRVDK